MFSRSLDSGLVLNGEFKMKIQEFLEIAGGLFLEARKTLSTKNEDYSTGEAFGAFDKEAMIARILDLDSSNRLHRALNEIVKRVVRLRNLGDKKPNHESIEDSCKDGVNFFALYYGMVVEKKDG